MKTKIQLRLKFFFNYFHLITLNKCMVLFGQHCTMSGWGVHKLEGTFEQVS